MAIHIVINGLLVKHLLSKNLEIDLAIVYRPHHMNCKERFFFHNAGWCTFQVRYTILFDIFNMNLVIGESLLYCTDHLKRISLYVVSILCQCKSIHLHMQRHNALSSHIVN